MHFSSGAFSFLNSRYDFAVNCCRAALVTVLLALAVQVRAAEVSGRVMDQTHTMISYGKVTLTNVSNSTRTFTTQVGADGRFVISGVPDGAYSIRVSATGFVEAERAAIDIRENVDLGEFLLQVAYNGTEGGIEIEFVPPATGEPTAQRWLDASDLSRFRLPMLRPTRISVRRR
jgi:hypothetical protein